MGQHKRQIFTPKKIKHGLCHFLSLFKKNFLGPKMFILVNIIQDGPVF